MTTIQLLLICLVVFLILVGLAYITKTKIYYMLAGLVLLVPIMTIDNIIIKVVLSGTFVMIIFSSLFFGEDR